MNKLFFVVGSLFVLALFFFACTTIERPDMPPMKNTHGTYVAKQERVLGFIPLKPEYVLVPTKADETRTQLRSPAVWTVGISLPIALVAFAASIVLANPKITDKLFTLAAIAFLTAVGAGVWLLMTMWLIAFAAVAAGVAGYAYFRFHGKGINWGTKHDTGRI